MKDVQCYELFGGIALKNHAFSFSFSIATVNAWGLSVMMTNSVYISVFAWLSETAAIIKFKIRNGIIMENPQ